MRSRELRGLWRWRQVRNEILRGLSAREERRLRAMRSNDVSLEERIGLSLSSALLLHRALYLHDLFGGSQHRMLDSQTPDG